MEKRKEKLQLNDLVLKKLESKDKGKLVSYMYDPNISTTYMTPIFQSKSEEEKFADKISKMSENLDTFLYCIYLENELVGMINCVESTDDYIEIGYFVDHKMWNKGIATNSLKLVIEELFRMGYKKVVCSHFENNLASGKVMQKCGMTRTNNTEEIEYNGLMHKTIQYIIQNKNVPNI